MYDIHHLQGLMDGRELEYPIPTRMIEQMDLADLLIMLRKKGYTVRKVAVGGYGRDPHTHYRLTAQKDKGPAGR